MRNVALSHRAPRVFFESDDSLWGNVVVKDSGTSVVAAELSQLLDAEAVGDYVLVCDIEGSEADVWVKDAQSLARCKQILVELHETPNATVSLMARQIIDLGFEIRDRRYNVFFFERPTAGA